MNDATREILAACDAVAADLREVSGRLEAVGATLDDLRREMRAGLQSFEEHIEGWLSD